jgi:urease accessory protein
VTVLAAPTAVPADDPPERPADSGWHASLDLAFERRGERTRLASNRHRGPLRLLRALEGDAGSCHAVIVHPPGGLVGGDRLELSIALGAGSHVLCTTPGAQKWYRSLGPLATSATRIDVGPGALLEWLPQPAIVFDRANAEQSVAFDLADGARMIGWECMVLGRAAMAERFLHGSLRQRLALRRQGRLAWAEHSSAAAGDRLFESPLGWAGRTVALTVWAVAVGVGGGDGELDALLDNWRGAIDASTGGSRAGGATQVEPGVLVARLLADDSEAAMATAQALWRLARPVVAGVGPSTPRIWAT